MLVNVFVDLGRVHVSLYELLRLLTMNCGVISY